MHSFAYKRPLPLSAEEREALGDAPFTADDLAFLCEWFVGHPFEYVRNRKLARRKDAAGHRRTIPLTEYAVAQHLLGEHVIGTGARICSGENPRYWTRWFALDLDYGPDLLTRFGRVKEVFGLPSFTIRSSASGGIHVYYLLDRPYELFALRDLYGRRGVLIELLELAGLAEADKLIELYPRGGKRGKVQNRLRLPFGKESVLLNAFLEPQFPDDLPPLQARIRDLRYVQTLVTSGRVKVRSLDQLERAKGRLRDDPVSALARQHREKRQAHHARLVRNAAPDVVKLWEEGLPAAGTRQRACYTLAADLWRKGFGQAEAERELWAWLQSHHNGQSATYLRTPHEAQAEIRDIVARRWKDGPCVHRPEVPALSTFEVCSIRDRIRAYGDDGPYVVDPETGEKEERYRVERFAHDMLRLGKQDVLTEGTTALREAKGQLGSAAAQDEVDALAVRILKRRGVWPDPRRPEFVIVFPYSLRRRVKGTDRRPDDPDAALFKGIHVDRMPRLLRILKSAGVIARERHAYDGAAERLRVPLDFGARSPDQRAFVHAAQAIDAMGGSAQKRVTYSRRILTRIRQDIARLPEVAAAAAAPPRPQSVASSVGAVATAGPLHPVVRLIWRQLAPTPVEASGAA